MGSRGLRGAGLGEPRTRVTSQPCRRTYQRSRMSTVDVCGLGPDGDACAVRVSPSCSMDTCRRACRAPDPTPLWKVCGVVSTTTWCYPSPAPGYVYDVDRVFSTKLVYSRANVIRLSNNGASGEDARARRGGHGRAGIAASMAGPCPTAYVPRARCCVRTFIRNRASTQYLC